MAYLNLKKLEKFIKRESKTVLSRAEGDGYGELLINFYRASELKEKTFITV